MAFTCCSDADPFSSITDNLFSAAIFSIMASKKKTGMKNTFKKNYEGYIDVVSGRTGLRNKK